MLITKQRGSLLLHPGYFFKKQLQWKECDKEFVPAQVDTAMNNGRCCHKQDVWDGVVNMGWCHMWD